MQSAYQPYYDYFHLKCPICHKKIEIVGFITQPVSKIAEHLLWHIGREFTPVYENAWSRKTRIGRRGDGNPRCKYFYDYSLGGRY